MDRQEFLQFWNLTDHPFENTTNKPAFYYHGQNYEKIINSVYDAVMEYNLNIIVVCGAAGSGKSFTSKILRRLFVDEGLHVVYLENPAYTPQELYEKIVNQLTNETMEDMTKLQRAFQEICVHLKRISSQFILIADEAHVYTPEMLETIRMMINHNHDGYKYLSLIMVGQQELRTIIKSNKQINSRVKNILYFKPLSQEETGEFIQHKLKVAQGNINLLDNYIETIYKASLGSPREINMICQNILEKSYEKGSHIITKETVDEVIVERV